MKSGIKTSEFYVALAGIGGILLSFFQQNCPAITPEKILGVAIIVVGYIAGRSWVKTYEEVPTNEPTNPK